METWFGMVTWYSKDPPPSSGIIAAIRAACYPVGVLKFQKDETLRDENPWTAVLYDQESGELIALNSITAFYHQGHLTEVNTVAPVWVDIDPQVIEVAHEFLVNDGPKPVWWREQP